VNHSGAFLALSWAQPWRKSSVVLPCLRRL
jgi:hypothetical protein